MSVTHSLDLNSALASVLLNLTSDVLFRAAEVRSARLRTAKLGDSAAGRDLFQA